uniref:Putative secreted protein n=1 Tax=Ixodes ricinus TaxID=34613 RepID=V5ICK1_IXORI
MLPFSKMLLVVFAMVLILPALESGGFLSGEVLHYDCMDLLGDAGDLKCGLDGEGNCTLGPRETLRNWIDGLTKQRNKVLKTWCTCFTEK